MTDQNSSDGLLRLRLARTDQFVRQWRTSVERLQRVGTRARLLPAERREILLEAQQALAVVVIRSEAMAQMAADRGFKDWHSDSGISPLMIELRAIESALRQVVKILEP